MLPAVAWDSPKNERLPSVLGRLEQRQEAAADAGPGGEVGPTLLAFLFSPPDSDAMRKLVDRREYFDIRTGEIWDLFFPGYYRYGHMPAGVPVGDPSDSWGFSPPAFNELRRHIEDSSQQRWSYSGGDDLVLICSWVPAEGPPVVDWRSTTGGDLGSASAAGELPRIIERITRDLELGFEDPHFGVKEALSPSAGGSDERGKQGLAVTALAEILTAIGLKLSGL